MPPNIKSRLVSNKNAAARSRAAAKLISQEVDDCITSFASSCRSQEVVNACNFVAHVEGYLAQNQEESKLHKSSKLKNVARKERSRLGAQKSRSKANLRDFFKLYVVALQAECKARVVDELLDALNFHCKNYGAHLDLGLGQTVLNDFLQYITQQTKGPDDPVLIFGATLLQTLQDLPAVDRTGQYQHMARLVLKAFADASAARLLLEADNSSLVDEFAAPIDVRELEQMPEAMAVEYPSISQLLDPEFVAERLAGNDPFLLSVKPESQLLTLEPSACPTPVPSGSTANSRSQSPGPRPELRGALSAEACYVSRVGWEL